ncbi:MAG TPA: acyl-CoA dehydrogenase family protein, partial [Ilumatobacteraceae bacterium]|nr:acyl-CoA dehydrogenase family protein [Ilumatobacteraceae bacterium]
MRRELYDDDHLAFADSVRAWTARELTPNVAQWEADGIVPRRIFADAGQLGFTGMAVPERFGGGGSDDFRFNAVINEEFAAAGLGGVGLGITLHNDIVTPYFVEYCNDEQAARWLPGIASGELITALAMTEPGSGSDVAGFATTAIRDGDTYVLNGSKTFITNGINADLVVVAAKTDPTQRHSGLSLLVVERGMAGFERGRNLDKLGLHSQDTAELFFTDVAVPAANLLGDEGRGFDYLTANLAQERLSIAIGAVGVARAA